MNLKMKHPQIVVQILKTQIYWSNFGRLLNNFDQVITI